VRHNVALDEDTGSFHHVVFQLGNTTLGLHTFPQPPAPDDRFDEHRIGLDHVSFGLANREELQQWRSHLEKLGIEHGGIKDASYGSGVSFRDPDNNALEFFCPPST
jgi:glyoxylase I family protein